MGRARQPVDPLAQLRRQRPETDRVYAILEALPLIDRKVFAWRQNVGGADYPKVGGGFQHVEFGIPGLADIVGWRWECLDCLLAKQHMRSYCGTRRYARALYIEVKREKERPNPKQRAFLERAKQDGAIVIVATCVEDVTRGLKEYARG